MSKLIVFIHVHGQSRIMEAELSVGTLGELQDVLTAAGVTLDADTFIFVDEADDHVSGHRQDRICGLKHGCRIHVSRCKHIRTVVHYLGSTIEHEFAPGTRLRAVKQWAVAKFGINPKDAAEHVLQLCGSSDRPSTDTPLQQLISGDHCQRHACVLCFDLVPDKRVEG